MLPRGLASCLEHAQYQESVDADDRENEDGSIEESVLPNAKTDAITTPLQSRQFSNENLCCTLISAAGLVREKPPCAIALVYILRVHLFWAATRDKL